MQGFHQKLFPLALVFTVAITCFSQASDAAKIKDVLSNADSYQLHPITLEGIATQVQVIGPVGNTKCGLSYELYQFVLQDETGSILVVVPGTCGTPQNLATPVPEGSRVRVEAVINVFTGGQKPSTVQAIAKGVWLQEERS